MSKQKMLEFNTSGRGAVEITREVVAVVADAGISTGLCHIFIHHTSASLMLCENADPSVLHDLETLIRRMAPDADAAYRHNLEGDDDMAAHMRSILTNMDLTIPVTNGRAALGAWQGVFLWEHRTQPHRRRVTVTVSGE